MEAIQIFFEKVKLGGKQSHLKMTLFPLLASDAGEPGYLILEEALGQGVVEITEVSLGGSVPDLKLINKSQYQIRSDRKQWQCGGPRESGEDLRICGYVTFGNGNLRGG